MEESKESFLTKITNWILQEENIETKNTQEKENLQKEEKWAIKKELDIERETKNNSSTRFWFYAILAFIILLTVLFYIKGMNIYNTNAFLPQQ